MIKKQISGWFFAIWAGLWLSVAVIDVWPDIINRAANILGVGRGVDLMIYISLFVLFYSLFRLSARFSQLDKKISVLIQKIAIVEAKDKTE